jgi:NADPH:quinone reductase and related Zn-dependent oxidoreductases
MNDAVRSMRAMCASNSDPASLTSQNIPIPDPGPGELLVQVGHRDHGRRTDLAGELARHPVP